MWPGWLYDVLGEAENETVEVEVTVLRAEGHGLACLLEESGDHPDRGTRARAADSRTVRHRGEAEAVITWAVDRRGRALSWADGSAGFP
ncbi:hypothetical protein SVIO_003730 [Streptomyces violaceusniger]|uniref:Uncharacterized protein n=1 Tax=Streptomyces violaceusniger TaxID=68280 RepID=A0A4D4KT56_STRVO|nr:hypothetical protein SVIO_003730 [Streptomyces violaceusniger]